MSETQKKYDSVLVGWVDEPNYNDNQELMDWRVKLKKHEIEDMLEKYLTATSKNKDTGRSEGGNVYLTLFMSKTGKACARVYDPNSEGAKESRERKQAANVSDDLPF